MGQIIGLIVVTIFLAIILGLWINALMGSLSERRDKRELKRLKKRLARLNKDPQKCMECDYCDKCDFNRF